MRTWLSEEAWRQHLHVLSAALLSAGKMYKAQAACVRDKDDKQSSKQCDSAQKANGMGDLESLLECGWQALRAPSAPGVGLCTSLLTSELFH